MTRVGEIIKERRAITADTALRLERDFGMIAGFWLGLQKEFDVQTTRQSAGKKIAGDVRPRPSPPFICVTLRKYKNRD